MTPVVRWAAKNIGGFGSRQRRGLLGRCPGYASVPRQLHAHRWRARRIISERVKPDFDTRDRRAARQADVIVVEAMLVLA